VHWAVRPAGTGVVSWPGLGAVRRLFAGEMREFLCNYFLANNVVFMCLLVSRVDQFKLLVYLIQQLI
jgi:hypothetical protein